MSQLWSSKWTKGRARRTDATFRRGLDGLTHIEFVSQRLPHNGGQRSKVGTECGSDPQMRVSARNFNIMPRPSAHTASERANTGPLVENCPSFIFVSGVAVVLGKGDVLTTHPVLRHIRTCYDQNLWIVVFAPRKKLSRATSTLACVYMLGSKAPGFYIRSKNTTTLDNQFTTSTTILSFV